MNRIKAVTLLKMSAISVAAWVGLLASPPVLAGFGAHGGDAVVCFKATHRAELERARSILVSNQIGTLPAIQHQGKYKGR